jgi:hypothetical protein
MPNNFEATWQLTNSADKKAASKSSKQTTIVVQ